MEKKKINMDVEFENKTTAFDDMHGNTVEIAGWIPMAEKEAFAQELTA